MPTAPVTAEVIKAYILNGCGYQHDLVKNNYRFARGQSADVAAFAHFPSDARSACIAAIDCRSDDPQAEVVAHRELGAPLVFACLNNKAQVWKPGRHGAECLRRDLSASGVRSFFAQHKKDLTPNRIYEAKTRGRLPDSESRLPFVDLQLLPFAERELGERLTLAVIAVINSLEGTFGEAGPDAKQSRWIYKSTFRLLAAKALKDKQVPGFIRLNLQDVKAALGLVQQHYGSAEPVKLGNSRRQAALEGAVATLDELGNLQHLTTETLADVYERALVTETMREEHGTHATPPYLVDYMLWRLAPWIQEIDPTELRVFEPACGHAPFLVGMVRFLRECGLGMTPEELSRFLRQRFIGIDQDAFAVEIGRLALTVADVPRSNGWQGLRVGNMFAKARLEKAAAESRVFLANPPFEAGKPLRLLQKTLPYLPPGAVFGVIVPSTLLFTDKLRPTEFRRWLQENCQLMEVSLFPDNLFRFSDHECSVLLGRKHPVATRPVTMVSCRRVREEGREAFKEDYRFSTRRTWPQDRMAQQPGQILWVPELEEEVWDWLRHCPALRSIAILNQGVQYKNRNDLAAGTRTVESDPFPGAVEGYASSQGKWLIHEHPETRYFNLRDRSLFRREGSGTTTGMPQVLLNYAAARRGAWRLKPFINTVGRPAKGNLITVRPVKDEAPLEYLWALLCSPLANAYAYTHSLKRDILIIDLNRMPIPKATPSAVHRVVVAARAYMTAALSGPRDLLNQQGVGEEELHMALRRMDAEVLRLYGLPARAERVLLDLFAGQPRPGVRGNFTRYYPPKFEKPIPLYAYLSDAYQRVQNGGPAALPEAQQAAYDRLIGKKHDGNLTPQEEEELYGLQAEVDGRDYAVQMPDDQWVKDIESKRQMADLALGRLTDELACLVEHGNTPK